MIVVFTSNRPPDDLYMHGLQRYLFMPFIDLIHEKCHVLNLSSIDYRLLNQQGIDNFYSPFNEETSTKVDECWNKLTGNSKGEYILVEVA